MMPLKAGEEGFSLLEVIIILSILAMFAAMAVPLAGRLEARGRERETERLLTTVREAMLGPRGALDAGGRRVLAGYAGDLGGLPPLRRSVWNDSVKRWEWDIPFAAEQEANAFWASGMGQPQYLWLAPPDAVRWQGPYLPEPRDEFPANAEHLRWTFGEQLTDAQFTANREIEMRQTAGRLADAWGRSLLFFYVTPGEAGTELFQGTATVQTTVYVVSEGQDLRSSWPAYRLDTPENEDNLVLVITPQEWHDQARQEETRRLLQTAADALVGRFGPVDRLGRGLLGGFVGDHGRWPELLVWQDEQVPWRQVTGRWEQNAEGDPVWVPPTASDLVAGAVYGQPRGLWTRDTDGDGTVDLPLPPDPAAAGNVLLGFGWRGEYLPRPAGSGASELLRDAWGVPLVFRLSHAADAEPPPGQTLKIISAGQDGVMATADDLLEVVPRHFDVRRHPPANPPENIFTVAGRVVNETGQNRFFGVRLHASPASQPITTVQMVYGRMTVDGQIYGNAWDFSLPVQRSSAGARLLELVELRDYDPRPLYHDWRFLRRWDWTTVFVGSGGTATPEREPLVLRARDVYP